MLYIGFVVGIGLFILGIILLNKEKQQVFCMVQGSVVGYEVVKGIPHCKIEYVVNDHSYFVLNEYNSIHRVSYLMAKRVFKDNRTVFVENNELYILDGSSVNVEEFIDKYYPLQSYVDLYYNKLNPEIVCFNEKKQKSSAMICIWIGVLLIVLSECLHMVL